MNKIKQVILNVHIENETKTINHEVISSFASEFGLDDLVPNRYSWLLVIDMMMNLEINGIDPRTVVHEIQILEDATLKKHTKEPTQFKHPPLYPLWHQHFFLPIIWLEISKMSLEKRAYWKISGRTRQAPRDLKLQKSKCKNL